MGVSTDVWQRKTKARATEIARLLIRMGYATNGQLARLTGLDPTQARRVVSYQWNQFAVQAKVPSGLTKGRYAVPGNRVQSLVHLTPDAAHRWSEAEGIIPSNEVHPNTIPQRLNMVELLICLRHKGLLYDKWDMMLPQGDKDGLHAWLTNDQIGVRLGVYLLPMRFSKFDEARKGQIFQGILRRVTQNSNTQSTLFLATEEYYPAAFRSLVVFSQKDGTRFFLLPLESFTKEPEFYLDAIATNESHNRQMLVERCLRYKEKHPMQGQYDYAALLEFVEGRHRFVDAYANGSIDRVRGWLEHTLGYQIPNSGHIASAEVYVYDKVVGEALDAILRTKFKGRYEDSIVEVLPWPKVTGDTNVKFEMAPVQENSLLDDEEWWKVFND